MSSVSWRAMKSHLINALESVPLKGSLRRPAWSIRGDGVGRQKHHLFTRRGIRGICLYLPETRRRLRGSCD